jgi:hypothetical protein
MRRLLIKADRGRTGGCRTRRSTPGAAGFGFVGG